MKKKLLLLLSSFLTVCAHEYETRTVETESQDAPPLQLLSANSAHFNITNLTGHTINKITITFKFCDEKLSTRVKSSNELEFILGHVDFNQTKNRKTVKVAAHSAYCKQLKSKVAETFNKVENVIIIRIDNNAYPFYLSNSAWHENNLVISRWGDEDVIETKKHYKSRL